MSSKNFMSYEDATTVLGGYANAIKNKQDDLTAGNNIKIDNDTISVNRWFVPAGKVVYTVITSDENYGQNVHVQRHTQGGDFIDDRVYTIGTWQNATVDGLIYIEDRYAQFYISLLKNSDEQSAGYQYIVSPNTKSTSNSFTFTMEQEENANDLIIRSELSAVSSAVSAIKDGTSIDSFADVETALAGKQGTLTFDDVPTENSSNPVKSSGVKSAIDAAVSSAYHHAGTKTIAQLTHDLLVAANEGNVYNITDSGTTTSYFIEGIGKTIDEGSNVGICKVGNDYKFDLLSGFIDTTNFVQKSQTAGLLKNDGTVDTVAKQPVTDNNLETTAKTIVGAINEHEGDIDSLKSGLTNYQTQNNLNLEVPDRKNVGYFDLEHAKKASIAGVWSGNQYTVLGITYTVITDSNGSVTEIKASGTSMGDAALRFSQRSNYPVNLQTGSYIVSGGNNASAYVLVGRTYNGGWQEIARSGSSESSAFNVDISDNLGISINVDPGATVDDISFYPMIRLSSITDATFAPYVPSVESRIEAVESKIQTATFSGTTDAYGNISLDNYRYVIAAYAGGYVCIPFEYNYTRYVKILSTTDFTAVSNTSVAGGYTYIS